VHALLRQYRASAGAGAGANALLVAQGSVGSDLDGDTVLLGNPDMGAAYLSAALGAQRLEVWSAQRFAGFPSTDPQFDEKALMLERVSYAESVQLAALGALRVRLRVRSLVRQSRAPSRCR
jgi:aspartokinase